MASKALLRYGCIKIFFSVKNFFIEIIKSIYHKLYFDFLHFLHKIKHKPFQIYIKKD